MRHGQVQGQGLGQEREARRVQDPQGEARGQEGQEGRIGRRRLSSFEDLLVGWDGEEVLIRRDVPSGGWMFTSIHSTVLGPAAGGTRMKVYPAPADGLRDALRLGEAMTRKNAVAGLPLGGGKAVLAVPAIPSGDERRALLRRYGRLIDSLGGTYVTACDMNTTEADMDVVAEVAPHVLGRSVAAGGSGSSAPATALGVLHAMRAALAHVAGSPEPRGRTVLVQGAGAVGALLASMLAEQGADLLVCDVDDARAAAVAAATGARVVPATEALTTDCDVLSPCATGGMFSADTIAGLRCRVVVGAANNQLVAREDGDLFAAAGVTYIPDFVANAGGIIHLASLELLREDRATLDARIARIGETTMSLLRRADAEGLPTSRVADAIAEERIASARRADD